MNKIVLIIFSIAVIYFTGCKKDSPISKNSPTLSDNYWPVTTGSTWTYSEKDANDNNIYSNTIKLLGDTSMINGKPYYNITVTAPATATPIFGYLREDSHLYKLREVAKAGDIALEYQILIDTAAAGYTWTATTNETGNYAGVPSRVISKIVEKGITKTINGKTFDKVIHTQTQLQFLSQGTTYNDAEMHDFYFAKGIGMIEDIESNQGTVLYTRDLSDYTIK